MTIAHSYLFIKSTGFKESLLGLTAFEYPHFKQTYLKGIGGIIFYP
jgi:hypothetical protein